MAPPTPVRIKEVTYALSPYNQSIIGRLPKNLPSSLAHLLKGPGKDALLFGILPLYAVMWYCEDYREKEKLHHRY